MTHTNKAASDLRAMLDAMPPDPVEACGSGSTYGQLTAARVRSAEARQALLLAALKEAKADLLALSKSTGLYAQNIPIYAEIIKRCE